MSQPPSGPSPASDNQDLRQRLLDTERRLAELLGRELRGGSGVDVASGDRQDTDRLEGHAARLASLGGWQFDLVAGMVHCSEQAGRLLGLDGAASLPARQLLRSFDGHWRVALLAHLRSCLRHRTPFQMEAELWNELGGQAPPAALWCLITGEPIVDPDDRLIAIRGAVQDISQRRQADLALLRMQRARDMLSHCNEALLKASSELELVRAVTRLVIEEGGYHQVLVGFGSGDGKLVRFPQGMNALFDYRAQTYAWDPDDPSTLGPLTDCLEASRPVVCPNLAAEYPRLKFLDRLAEEYIVGCACMPFLTDGRAEGFIAFYTGEEREFTGDELRLLRELSANVWFGIRHLRAQVQREASQKALIDLATAVTASVGPEFFQHLTAQTASALQADGCFIARIDHDQGVAVARCFAGVLDNQPAPNLEYRLADTPCQELLTRDGFVVTQGVRQNYPKDPHLWDLEVEAYAGQRLSDSKGRASGILFVLYRQPMADPVTVTSTMKIFAARAAAELERLKVISRLHEQASLLDRASDAIVVRDLNHTILYWNRGAERLYGWSRKEAEGQRVDRLCYEGDDQYREAMQVVLEEGEWQGQLDQCCKSGERLVVSAHWSLVTDDSGTPVSIMAINTDITRRLALEEQLHQSQRLESIGQLTGGVAHDFNNLLTVILGNAELLEESLEDNPSLLGLIRMVRAAAERGSELTQRLLAFARRQTLAPKTIDINELLVGMDGLLRRAMPAYLDIEIQRGFGLWPVVADPAQLESAILNLTINARDAMGQGGIVRIDTSNVRLVPGELDTDFPPQAGEFVVVMVRDNGCGMTPDIAAKAFDPFFTTKEKGKGTGLGLSMVYGFIKQSGGHVDLRSDPGQGTAIRLYLPRADELASAEAVSSDKETSHRGAGHILVVEDDDLVRRYAEEQLRGLGYEVISVRDGREALEVLDRAAPVDLLFTDVVMPGMNGRELAARAQAMRPGLKVLYTSGYAENAMARAGHLDEGISLLGKPYRHADLARSVGEIMNQTTISR